MSNQCFHLLLGMIIVYVTHRKFQIYDDYYNYPIVRFYFVIRYVRHLNVNVSQGLNYKWLMINGDILNQKEKDEDIRKEDQIS